MHRFSRLHLSYTCTWDLWRRLNCVSPSATVSYSGLQRRENESVTVLCNLDGTIRTKSGTAMAIPAIAVPMPLFACAHRGNVQITLARETTSPAGKEVEAVTELALLEKPKRSKLIATLYSRRPYAYPQCNGTTPRPRPRPLFSRALGFALCGRRDHPFGACDAKISDATSEIISSIGRLIGQRFGVPSRHLFQRLAVSLWRGNATAWIHRCRPPAPFIDGVV